MKSRACFFELGGAGRHSAIFTTNEVGYFEVIANLAEDRSSKPG